MRSLVACTALILLAACGSPAPEHREFTFTPVPYITFYDTPGPQSWALVDGSTSVPGPVHIQQFVRTPTPYIVFTDDRGTLQKVVLGWSEDGRLYRVDEVSARLSVRDERTFVDWIEGYGFTVQPRFRIEFEGMVTLVMTVPPGSAPAALDLIQSRRGVQEAWLSEIYFLAKPP